MRPTIDPAGASPTCHGGRNRTPGGDSKAEVAVVACARAWRFDLPQVSRSASGLAKSRWFHARGENGRSGGCS
jgi:hypothetical protein